MTRDQLRSAITGPVGVAGGQITPRLLLRLLNDVGDNQDQLPVFQHALMRTWEHWQDSGRAGEAIDIADYEAVGTMGFALSNHAEEAYQETVSEGIQQVAERVFKALTDTFSDPRGIRRPTPLQELASIGGAPESDLMRVIEIFRRTGRSFLMPQPSVPLTPETIVDISHESLMRCWTRLIAWAEEENQSALAYTRIAQAAKWFQAGSAGLWRDPELELGLGWRRQAQPTAAWAQRYEEGFDAAMQFLDGSAEERERTRIAAEKTRKRILRQYQLAAAVFATLLVGAVVLAFVARTQRARAEYYLQQAQNAVNEMLSSAGRQQARVAADVPEMDAFRKELLDKAKVFYSSFEQREPTNDDIRAEMARAHFRLGDINRLLENENAAVEQYQHAISDFDRLARKYPQQAGLRQWLANSYNWLGETLRMQPATRAQAEQAYDRALSLQEVLVRDNPQEAGYRREMARTHYNRGIVRYSNRQWDDTAADFRRAIELLQSLVGVSADPGVSQELARAYNNLGVLLRQRDHASEAEPLFQQAAALDGQLTTRYPENRDYRFELATYYNNLALLSLDEKQYELAQQRNRQALNLLEDLARPAPSLSMQLAQGYNLAAEVSEPKGAAAVRVATQRSQEVLDKLARHPNVQGRPELRQLYRDLGYNYLELAQLELRSSSVDDAQQALDKCLRLLPQLSEAEAKDLKQSYQKLQQEVQNRRATR
jgi:tetratricopeptide (TPR) repeat protein